MSGSAGSVVLTEEWCRWMWRIEEEQGRRGRKGESVEAGEVGHTGRMHDVTQHRQEEGGQGTPPPPASRSHTHTHIHSDTNTTHSLPPLEQSKVSCQLTINRHFIRGT